MTQLDQNPFIYAFTIFMAIMVLILVSCGSEENTEPEILSAPGAEETVSANEEKEPDGGEYTYKESHSLKKLPKITSVSIATRSGYTKDGFEAHAEMDSGGAAEAELIYEWKLNGDPIRAETGNVLDWREDFAKGDTLTVLVTPVSEYGQGVWQAEGSIVIPNSPPVISSSPGDLFESGEFSYTVEAVDPDGDEFDFALRGAPEGMVIEPATGLISWVYGIEDAGEHEVIIVVTDIEGAQATQTLTFTIYDENNPPDPTP